MNKLFLYSALYAVFLCSCGHHHETGSHETQHEDKLQYTAYSDRFEVFAEADPFVAGKASNILSHFSVLPDFKALEKGKITITLKINGTETAQTLDKPARKGIYSFDLTPGAPGKGFIKYSIQNEDGLHELTIPDITVYATSEEAEEAVGKNGFSNVNTTVFTKEQSWKIDFATAYPSVEPFGPVIKTTAILSASPGSERIITAKTAGTVMLPTRGLLEGKEIHAGQTLFTVSGGDLADNNFAVRFAEAKNNYEKSKTEYDRAADLAKEKIISEKELLSAKTDYENAKMIYENLNKNFTASGQSVASPMSGFVKQVFVKNGAFVETGQPVLTLSQNKFLMLTADVSQRHASVLGFIRTANIRNPDDNRVYTLEQLNGKILSYGKSVNPDNFHIPVLLQIENRASFIEGGIVDIYLKTVTQNKVVTVPNSALLEEQGLYFVWAQLTPELFEKREVQTGLSDGLKTEIRNGLRADERIVTRGAMMIKLSQSAGTLDAHAGHNH